MCSLTGMQRAVAYMIPVIDFAYRDKCTHLYRSCSKNPEKAHLYY